MAGPNIEAILAIAIFGARIFSVPCSHKGMRILGNVQRLLQMLVFYAVSVAKFTQESQRKLAK